MMAFGIMLMLKREATLGSTQKKEWEDTALNHLQKDFHSPSRNQLSSVSGLKNGIVLANFS
jgi:hypothetical protein